MLPQRRRGSFLLIALIALAVVGVVIGIVLTRSPRLDGRSMMSWFPEREAVVVYLDVDAMRSSGVLDKLVGSTVGEAADYREFVQGTGFDYKRDLKQAMLNSAGGIHYFLLEGRFDWEKLRGWAQHQGGRCDGDLCWMAGSTPERVISFRRLRDDLMALATARDESGARAIEQRSAATPKFETPSTPVWAHVPSDAIRTVGNYPAGTRLFAKALEAADRAVFTLGPAGSTAEHLRLAMDVTCSTQEDAAVLKAQLEGVTALLQKLITREGQQPSAADLSGVLTSGSFTREGAHVLGAWSVPRALIDSLGSS